MWDEPAQLRFQASGPRRPWRVLETGYLAALVLSCFLDLWTAGIPIGQLHFRLSEILVFPGMLFLAGYRPRAGGQGRLPPYAITSLALPGFFLGWTLINSLDPALALAHSVLLTINVLHYWVIAVLAGRDWERYYRVLRWVGVCISLMGAWMGLSYVLGSRGLLNVGTMEGMAMGAGLHGGQTYRLSYGVLAGCFGSWAAVVCLGGFLGAGKQRKQMLIGALAGGFIMVLGLSRGAIVCVVVGLIVYILLLLRQGRIRQILAGLLLTGLAAVLIGWGLLTFFPSSALTATFVGRLALLLHRSGYDSGTVVARLQSWHFMWNDIRRNPFWGQGGDSYHIYFPREIKDSENFFLEILHATGIWGGLTALILIIGVTLRAYRTIFAQGLTSGQRDSIAGVLAAFLGLFVASQTNPIGWSALFWLALGLVAATTRLPAKPTASKLQRRSQLAGAV